MKSEKKPIYLNDVPIDKPLNKLTPADLAPYRKPITDKIADAEKQAIDAVNIGDKKNKELILEQQKKQ